eukprot:gene28947-35963_t
MYGPMYRRCLSGAVHWADEKAMQKEVGKHDKKEYVESAEHRMKTMEKERRLKKERWLREKELANAPMEGANDPLPGGLLTPVRIPVANDPLPGGLLTPMRIPVANDPLPGGLLTPVRILVANVVHYFDVLVLDLWF